MVERPWYTVSLWFYKTALKLGILRLQYGTEAEELGLDGQKTVILYAELKWLWQR